MHALGARAAIMAGGVLIGVLRARGLGPGGLGVYGLLIVASSLSIAFMGLGFGRALNYFLAANRERVRFLFRASCRLALAGTCVSILILLAVWRCPFSPWREIPPPLFVAALAVIPADFFRHYLNHFLYGQLLITESSLAGVLASLTNLAALLVLVIWLRLGVAGALLASLLAASASALFALYHYRRAVRERPAGDADGRLLPLIGRLWQYSRWYYSISLTDMCLNRLPFLMLQGSGAGSESLGHFWKAWGMREHASKAAFPVAGVLFSHTAASGEANRTERTNVVCRLSFPLMALLACAGLLLARPVILVLYGRAYLPAANVFFALLPAIALTPLSITLGSHVSGMGRPHTVLVSNLAALAATVAACLVLIPRHGMVGAGAGVSIGALVLAAVRLFRYVGITGTAPAAVLLPRSGDGKYLRWALRHAARRLARRSRPKPPEESAS